MAGVWFSLDLRASSIALALLVSTCTTSYFLASSFSSSTRTISKKSRCLSVEGLILVPPQLLNDGLHAQHEELVPQQVQPELQVLSTSSVVQDGVDEGHDGGLNILKGER